MPRKQIRLLALPAVLLALVSWACTDIQQPLAPSGASFTESTVKYTVAKGLCDGGKTKTDSQVVQPNAGGDVGIAGNVLIVPKHATSKPTLFVMEAKNAGCSGSAELSVKLTALEQDEKGEWKVSVGHLGFQKPLELRMTFEPMTDPVDPANLRVVWLKADGTQQVYSSTIGSDKRIHTQLDHFSQYALAFP